MFGKGSMVVLATTAVVTFGAQVSIAQEQAPMTFFVTSVGIGEGANLGGLAGADAHCQQLAAAAGPGDKTWRAYLSQTADAEGVQAINARDRIGSGPWHNAKGVRIAADVADLHGDIQRSSDNIRKPTAIDENGLEISGSGDQPNRHDILTGSDSHGRALTGAPAMTTCSNWTGSGEGSAMVGHHDRLGGPNSSWNAVHPSRGCSQENLRSSGGDGLFYCFAID